MDDIYLPPINLALAGLRRAAGRAPDLITVWKTPYPVLTNYKKLCSDLGLVPFAGGTYKKQGPSTRAGYITSGYRFTSSRKHSPHRFGLAIDVAVGDIEAQVDAANTALAYFTRIGFYPDNGFIHLDLANKNWMSKYGGRRYWVRKGGIYSAFDDFNDAVDFARD